MRILFKEEDPLTAQTLERQLRSLGHSTERIIEVGKIFDATNWLIPDAIVTDISIYDLGDLDFIRMIKCSPLSHVPIIAISGGGTFIGGSPEAEKNFVAEAVDAFGPIIFLRKPVSRSELKQAIDECLKGNSPAKLPPKPI